MKYRKLPHGDEQISIIGPWQQLAWHNRVRQKRKRRLLWRWRMVSTILIWRLGMPHLPRLWPGCFRLPG